MKGDTYKATIHDGSVSYSVVRIAPPQGAGKHTKTAWQISRRRACSEIARTCKSLGKRKAYEMARFIVYGIK